MTDLPNYYSFEDRDMFVEAVSARIAFDILQKKGAFLFGASGGSTPIPVYEMLCRTDLPWQDVTIALVDERFVPPGDPASNETAIRNSLHQGGARAADFIGLWVDEGTADAAAKIAEKRIIAQDTAFDTILLGMGPDGHFASIFPGALQLNDALDLENSRKVMALTPTVMPEHAPHPRLTLTLAEIARAKKLLLALNGNEKLDVLRLAYQERDSKKLPIAALFADNMPPLDIYWSL